MFNLHAASFCCEGICNIHRHCDSHHSDKFTNLQGNAGRKKELLSGLRKQQSIFSHSMDVSDATVRASFLITNEIAVASEPFSDGDFVKNCLLTATDFVCHEKRQSFANISLASNTSFGCISDLAADVDGQLKEEVASSVALRVAIDESADITYIAQIVIFIVGVD